MAHADDSRNTDTLPEAPVSQNLHVDFHNEAYPSLPRVIRQQIATRGTTVAEMVARLGESLDALTRFWGPRLAPRAERLAALKARWLEQAVERGNFPCAQRVLKAAALVALDAVSPACQIGVWEVRSASDPTAIYLVHEDQDKEPASCDCPDFTHRQETAPGQHCKHLLAVLMEIRLRAQEVQG